MSATPRRPAVIIRTLFRIVVIANAALLLAQPALAGLSLDGVGGALDLHYLNGTIVLGMAALLDVLAILWWKPAGGAWWPAIVAIVYHVSGLIQMEAGHAAAFGLHLPLGVSMVVLSWVLIAAAFSPWGHRRAAPASAAQ